MIKMFDCLIAVTLALPLPLAGQAAARQGTLTDIPHRGFTSPMVVEVPLDSLRSDETGGVYPFTDQSTYVCEDASISMILIKKSIREGGSIVRLKIESSVFVRPSYDRKVSLHYSLISAGKELEPMTIQDISAKEKKTRSESSNLDIPKGDFDGLFKGGSHPVLKVVMTVEPDR